MSPELGTIASILGAIGSATGLARTIFGGGGDRGGAAGPTTLALPQLPRGPLPADLAAAGLMRPELAGAATPAWRAGLAGGTTGPLPGAGGLLAAPIASRDARDATPSGVSGLMGEAANIFGSL